MKSTIEDILLGVLLGVLIDSLLTLLVRALSSFNTCI